MEFGLDRGPLLWTLNTVFVNEPEVSFRVLVVFEVSVGLTCRLSHRVQNHVRIISIRIYDV